MSDFEYVGKAFKSIFADIVVVVEKGKEFAEARSAALRFVYPTNAVKNS